MKQSVRRPFSRSRYILFWTVGGGLFGYLVFHPLTMVVSEFFHVQGDELHFYWENIFAMITASYTLVHLPHAGFYGVLAALIGHFFAKTIYAYEEINHQLERFSQIGINAASIIHDLSNPTAGIVLAAQLLKDEVKDPQLKESCELLQSGAVRISKMIRDIKITAQGVKAMELSRKLTGIRPFLDGILSRMDLRCKVKVDSNFDGEVLIDKDYFERVLWNLIKNAAEALKGNEGGRIEISLSQNDDSQTFCISDNGPGIPGEVRKNLFGLGQTSGKRGGSGIGLYNCRKIVEAHGGSIWVESEVNKGTKFYIRIPRHKKS